MADVMAQVLDSMKLLFEKYQTKVTFNAPSDVDFTLKGDRTHLTSVVYNLVENALKYGGKNIKAVQDITLWCKIKMLWFRI